MDHKNIQIAGIPLNEAKKVLIMVHGRGATAQDILGLASHLNVSQFALIAPQAHNHTWYPLSFLAKIDKNEPWISSALDLLKETVDDAIKQGITHENIYFLGFSQGACLALEYVARNAKKYGGVAAFTGGLIGEALNLSNYSGDFDGTPIFIGTGDPDSHVPLERVKESVDQLEKMNASVHVKVYENKPHSISKDEIDWANKLIFKKELS